MKRCLVGLMTAVLGILLTACTPPTVAPPAEEKSPIVEGAWSQASFPVAGKQVTVYLYAPDAKYHVQKDHYCGALQGQTNASAEQWAFYASIDGTPAALIKEIGPKGFPGGRGLKALPLNDRTTILALGDYRNCANPHIHDLWAYDHATNQIYRPRMIKEDGRVAEATAALFQITPQGLMVSESYSNAGADMGWHTFTYRWDQTERMWIFQDHQRKR